MSNYSTRTAQRPAGGWGLFGELCTAVTHVSKCTGAYSHTQVSQSLISLTWNFLRGGNGAQYTAAVTPASISFPWSVWQRTHRCLSSFRLSSKRSVWSQPAPLCWQSGCFNEYFSSFLHSWREEKIRCYCCVMLTSASSDAKCWIQLHCWNWPFDVCYFSLF